jgi:hypothetical protein
VRAAYVSREEWGATEPTKKWTFLNPKRVEGIVIHHSGVVDGPTGATAVQAFERHHMRVRGWSSIAYNWMVDVDGTIYEGRRLGAVGGATKNWNFKTEAVSYIGNGSQPLSLEAQEGFRTVIDGLQHTYGGGLWIKGHRDLASTSCPGDWLYDWVMSGAAHEPPPGAHVPHVDWDGVVAYLRSLGGGLDANPLKRRMRGDKVRMVQAILPRWKCDPGPADGIFGWRTKAAVRLFQRQRGFLKPNGEVNKATWDALFFM